MSSTLTKVLLSMLPSIYNEELSVNDTLSRKAFSFIYGAMCLHDLINFYKGSIKTITNTNAENLVSLQKEYRIHEINIMKFLTSSVILCTDLYSLYSGSQIELYKTVVIAAAAVDTLVDALNWDMTETFAYAINGDDSLEIF